MVRMTVKALMSRARRPKSCNQVRGTCSTRRFWSIGGLRAFCRLVILAAVCWPALLSASESQELISKPLQRVLFLISRGSSNYSQVVTAGSHALAEHVDITTVDLSENPEKLRQQLSLNPPELVVTVGTAAAEMLYKELFARDSSVSPPHTVLSTLLTRSAYQVFTQRYPGLEDAKHTAVVAQFIDQPLTRQLQLAKLLRPEAETAALLVGPANKIETGALQALSESLSLELEPVSLSAEDNPIRKIQPALAANELFIPIADSRQFNSATSRWVLQLSYRYRRPVVAFSASYVAAGALAAVHTSANNVASQVAMSLSEWQKSGFPAHGYQCGPGLFSLTFNPATAAALGINLLDESYYRGELERSIDGGGDETR